MICWSSPEVHGSPAGGARIALNVECFSFMSFSTVQMEGLFSADLTSNCPGLHPARGKVK